MKSQAVQYFRNASHVDCRQLEKEKLSSQKFMHVSMLLHSHNTNNIIFTCTPRTLHPAPAVKCSLFWNIYARSPTYFLHSQDPTKQAQLPSAQAGANCVLPVPGGHCTCSKIEKKTMIMKKKYIEGRML
jgi:hypothetical protein